MRARRRPHAALIDQLAELAGQRDRDALDGCFVDLLDKLIEPRAIAALRVVGDPGDRRWLVRHARRQSGATRDATQPLGNALLPAFAERPLHAQAHTRGEVVAGATHAAKPPGWTTVVPFTAGPHAVCLVEIDTDVPLPDDQHRLLHGLQRFYEVRPTDLPSDAFARADNAVYEAKHSGRNRVVAASVPDAGEVPADTDLGGVDFV